MTMQTELGNLMLTSLLTGVLESKPDLTLNRYYKPTMTALSHALETQIANAHEPLIFANFQQERFYRWEAKRYGEFAKKAKGTYVLAVAETSFSEQAGVTCVPLSHEDPMANEWHLIILEKSFCCAQILREVPTDSKDDAMRQFEGFWTMEVDLVRQVALVLVKAILERQPQLSRQLLGDLFGQDLPNQTTATHPEALTKLLLNNVQYAYQRLHTLGALQQIAPDDGL